jgi:SulP family sulfate permease
VRRLRLRGPTTLGATLVDVLSGYDAKLREVNGRLFLTRVSENVRKELAGSRKLQMSGPVQVFEATPIRGQSTRAAYEQAEQWLVDHGA